MSDNIINKKFRLSLILNTGFAILELVTGFFSGSLALISDATHNLTDSATLVISFAAQKISQKKPSKEHTFGYGKIRILAALTNCLIMLTLAATIFVSAYKRWHNPQIVNGWLIAAIAFIGILVNGTVAAIFFKHRSDLNVKTAFLNMAFDTLTSVAALICGVVIYFTGFEQIDSLVGVFIGIMMIVGCVQIINSAVHIILEGAPEDLNPELVKNTLQNLNGIVAVDDFHLWTIASGHPALSCHLVIDKTKISDPLELTKQAKKMLADKFNIKQTAIEIGTERVPEHEH